jgi:hypothetical protein
MMMGTPVSQQKITFDTRRLNDFREISQSVENYYRLNSVLPGSLEILKSSYNYLTIIDPESNEVYQYIIDSPTSYNLCTTFSTDGKQFDRYLLDDYNGSRKGTFKAGYNCFTYSIPNSMITPQPYR